MSLCLRDAAVPLGVGREASFWAPTLSASTQRVNKSGDRRSPRSRRLLALALGATEEQFLRLTSPHNCALGRADEGEKMSVS
eukprot:CAMPEP_0197463684 /NCGR_PEP_ID=MMETSP1175-20131217/62460_1 /TAXON_ID=1003142 /ORGANISM="Triceratium dubium, Strain CCMP147" /LENGTH=81 /DNA_ID=CAMNT_0042999503 /DNA_START=823 /DNA_END=1064 /DNA_ORIENTATION=-